ncbi:MAG: cbb3-type cytochrome c oxidase subunit I [Actinomycetes bacterium]
MSHNHRAPVIEPLGPGADLDRSRSLALRYLIASTVILGASGLLGLVLRDSQAGVDRVHDGWWYAIMTAHGLGAFVGWAAFALMGLSFWVLAQVGFPLRRAGAFLAQLTWWLMVVGVAGVVVTCLVFEFGGSWVFLYPITLHGAGVWGKWTAFFFSGSVLLVGLAIITWCLSILDTVTGPALGAVKKGIFNRLGVAMGFGYVAPKRFATESKSVPYSVIPLTVIAIDMIIATLPLAVLLVEMMVQALTPSVHVDPLLAKNILWFFGHPVVYLLLFPSVALYYLLVPRYAGRPLVAGNIIAVAWAIAVTANVLVWAHHIYIDYPSGSPQAALNVTMEPLTFSVTIVSALSLYSLFFTIFRSRFQWNAASTAIFLGLASWMIAGFSGLINATIAFDQIIHNTLWIVGHFHQMAFLGIGFTVIGATYAFLPQFVDKPLYSESMARWHVWITFIFTMYNSSIWMYQGLLGGPRRFAILPHRYDSMNQLAVPVSLIIGLAQILFAWNIIQTMRGKGVGRTEGAGIGSTRAIIVGSLVLTLASVGGWAAYRAQASTTSSTATPATTTTSGESPEFTAGKQAFASAGCAGCHTLKAAGAAGAVGPNFDVTAPDEAKVIDRVANGRNAMPPYKGKLTTEQIKDIAVFISQSEEGSG